MTADREHVLLPLLPSPVEGTEQRAEEHPRDDRAGRDDALEREMLGRTLLHFVFGRGGDRDRESRLLEQHVARLAAPGPELDSTASIHRRDHALDQPGTRDPGLD